MTTTTEKPKKAKKKAVKPPKVKKSKIELFWEKYPDGIGDILDMRAVLK